MSEIEEGEGDAAAAAFEALRDEVAHLRAALGTLAPLLKSLKAPDYSPTLGAIVQRLEKIEGHPALKLTPEQHRLAVDRTADAVRHSMTRDVQAMIGDVRRAGEQILQVGGQVRTRDQQRKTLLYVGGGSLVAGAVLWAAVAGPLARSLPASWAVPERMAAATLRADRWAAGERLMQSANPQGWANLVAAAKLSRDNASALEACGRSAAKAGKPQSCRILVSPPAGDDERP